MARRNKKGRRAPKALSRGTISVAAKGYGFVDTPEGEFFIRTRFMRGAMDGDVVEISHLNSLESRQRRQRRPPDDPSGSHPQNQPAKKLLGSVQRVLERAHQTIIGTLHYVDGLGVVTPHNQRICYDIFLDNRAPQAKTGREGDMVVVRLTTYPSRLESAQGYIEEILGRQDDQGINIQVILREHHIDTAFPAAALEQAQSLVPITLTPTQDQSELSHMLPRRDLRSTFIFTIDPTDAKDFDDALSVEFINGQLHLGVHIADVSSYVEWASPLDLAARRRSTSVYLPGQVIPMLPHELSNSLCSLNPGQDKAAFTVDMLIDNNGAVLSTQLYPSLIRSSSRLTYDQVTQIFSQHNAGEPPNCSEQLLTRLLALRKLSKKLLRRRLAQGAIDFEGTEPKITLNDKNKPIHVELRSKTAATSLVEEAMILANEQVAAYMLKQGAPMVYRIHEEPYPASLQATLPVLQEFGYATQGLPQTSADIQRILNQSSNRPEHNLISTLLLRAMKRARYSPVYTMHFGLASLHYTHFTSPIRRYPDLMVHRLLKYQLAQQVPPPDMAAQLEALCSHCSQREREAEFATNEATALMLCEFLEPRVGEAFTGIIVSVSSSGFMVREDATSAEGLVSVDDVPQGYFFDFKHQRFYDPENNRAFRLGQPIQVILKGVDPSRQKLQFTVILSGARSA